MKLSTPRLARSRASTTTAVRAKNGHNGHSAQNHDTSLESERQNMRGVLAAVDSAYAYIEFDTQGQVLTANPLFLKALGYQLDEIVGKHHRLFVDPAYANSPAYTKFWNDLSNGHNQADVFKRITKDGQGDLDSGRLCAGQRR